MSSSQDLHPKHGARFVFLRTTEEDEAPVYDAEVFLPEARTLKTCLAWNDDGKPTLRPPVQDAAVEAQLLKLARVLKRTPKARLSRWRDV